MKWVVSESMAGRLTWSLRTGKVPLVVVFRDVSRRYTVKLRVPSLMPGTYQRDDLEEAKKLAEEIFQKWLQDASLIEAP